MSAQWNQWAHSRWQVHESCRYIAFSRITCWTIYTFFFFNDTATTEIYTLSLHDALPIYTQLRLQWQCKSGYGINFATFLHKMYISQTLNGSWTQLFLLLMLQGFVHSQHRAAQTETQLLAGVHQLLISSFFCSWLLFHNLPWSMKMGNFVWLD